MTDETRASGAGTGLDLDEDLFGFAEHESGTEQGDVDLDDVFAAFEQEEIDDGHDLRGATTRRMGSPEAIQPELPEPARRDEAPAAPAQVAEPAAATPAEVRAAEVRSARATPAPTASPRARSGPRLATVAVLLAVVALNATVLAWIVERQGALQEQVLSGVGTILREADANRAPAGDAPARFLSRPDPSEHPTFDRALEEIESGDYARARERIYALLAIVDRMEASEREEVEARAHYLLAHALHLEAVTTAGERR